jgi:uncharacterized protein YukE
MQIPDNPIRGNRPIDRIRESAGSAKIPDGHGNIVSAKTIKDRIYFLAEHGLSSGVMADQIDPERTNPDIPFMVQRVELTYGVGHPFIQKTVCTPFELIDQTYIPTHVDKDAMLTLAVEVATSLSSVMDVLRELQAHQDETKAKGQTGQLSAAYVPRTANLKGKVHQCVAALRDVAIAIQRMSQQFYPKEAQNEAWDQKLKPALIAQYGDKDGFLDLLTVLWKTIDGVSDHRNAMIHPDYTKSLTVYDYELDPAGVFVAPTIEIVHPRSAVARRDVAQFLEGQVDDISYVYETLLAHTCSMNVRPLNDMFESNVAELPNGERRNGSRLVWQTVVKERFPNLDAVAGSAPTVASSQVTA